MSYEIGNMEKGMLIHCESDAEMINTKTALEKEGVITRKADREDGPHNLIVVDFRRVRR